MVIRKIRKKEKMKKYYRITKDITLAEGEILSELKEGDILFPCNDNDKYTILNTNTVLTIGLVKKNPEIFKEIDKKEFEFSIDYFMIRDIILSYSDVERNHLIDKLYKEFMPGIHGGTIIPQYNPHLRCHMCGLPGNRPCLSDGCPNRLAIWFSNSTDIK
jgi:hypothetical protein